MNEWLAVPDLQAIAERMAKLKRLIELQHRKTDELQTLLNTALHELAVERGEQPPQFALRWLRRHRQRDIEGVRFFNQRGERREEAP